MRNKSKSTAIHPVYILAVLLLGIGLKLCFSGHREATDIPEPQEPITPRTARLWRLPIPFTISSAFTADQKADIVRGIQSIMDSTCIDFVEHFGSGRILEFSNDGSGCESFTGDIRRHVNGNQKVQLADGCLRLGTIQHEIMHALGFIHTQSRADRVNYISVNTSMIIPDHEKNFVEKQPHFSPDHGIPFEYGSVLMYSPYAFRKEGHDGPVIVPRDPDYLSSMGNQISATFYDMKMINLRYSCNDSCSVKIECENGGYQNPRDCSRCICSDFHYGKRCEHERGVIALKLGKQVALNFRSGRTSKLMKYGRWAGYYLDLLRVIKAPKDTRIRVSIEILVSMHWNLRDCVIVCNDYGIEIADGDLAFTGKRICCTENAQRKTFISKSNVIGYRAYAKDEFPFKAKVTFSIVSAKKKKQKTANVTVPLNTTVSTKKKLKGNATRTSYKKS